MLCNFRLKKSLTGTGWSVHSALSERLLPVLLAAQAGNCFHGVHKVRFATQAKVGGVTVWTDEYNRATRKCSKYFQVTDKLTADRKFVEITTLSVCLQCQQMWLMGRLLRARFYGVASQYTVTRAEYDSIILKGLF